MRRLSLILLASLLVLPAAALAARTDKGDGVLELKAADGTFILTGRGVLLGQIDKGTLRVQALDPSAAPPAISGAEHTKATDDPTVTLYWGTNIHFRVTDGRYKIRFKGTGLDLTAVGVGVAELSGDVTSFDPGLYQLDGGKWNPVPYVNKYVPYGTGTVAPTTGP